MIFVLELPEGRPPRAWFAFDTDDFARKLDGSGLAELHAAGRCRIYRDEAEALAAFERSADPDWAGDGWRARRALHGQLIATEVLAED